MTIKELGATIEKADGNIHCFVSGGRLIATFTTRKDIEIEVLTPYEKRLLEQERFTQEDIFSKIFELKRISNYGN